MTRQNKTRGERPQGTHNLAEGERVNKGRMNSLTLSPLFISFIFHYFTKKTAAYKS